MQRWQCHAPENRQVVVDQGRARLTYIEQPWVRNRHKNCLEFKPKTQRWERWLLRVWWWVSVVAVILLVFALLGIVAQELMG